MPAAFGKRTAPALIALLIVLALGGLDWLIANRAVFGSIATASMCRRCAMVQQVKVRTVFEIRGAPAVRVFASPISKILRAGSNAAEGCEHAWELTGEVRDEMHFRPLPQGRTVSRQFLRLGGLSDHKQFQSALAALAKSDPAAARSSWEGLLFLLKLNNSILIRDLRKALSDDRPAAEIAEQLRNFARKPAVTADRSAP